MIQNLVSENFCIIRNFRIVFMLCHIWLNLSLLLDRPKKSFLVEVFSQKMFNIYAAELKCQCFHENCFHIPQLDVSLISSQSV